MLVDEKFDPHPGTSWVRFDQLRVGDVMVSRNGEEEYEVMEVGRDQYNRIIYRLDHGHHYMLNKRISGSEVMSRIAYPDDQALLRER